MASVKDPFDSILVEQRLVEEEGRIAFSSEHSGDHRLCFEIGNPTGNDEYV